MTFVQHRQSGGQSSVSAINTSEDRMLRLGGIGGRDAGRWVDQDADQWDGRQVFAHQRRNASMIRRFSTDGSRDLISVHPAFTIGRRFYVHQSRIRSEAEPGIEKRCKNNSSILNVTYGCAGDSLCNICFRLYHYTLSHFAPNCGSEAKVGRIILHFTQSIEICRPCL